MGTCGKEAPRQAHGSPRARGAGPVSIVATSWEVEMDRMARQEMRSMGEDHASGRWKKRQELRNEHPGMGPKTTGTT